MNAFSAAADRLFLDPNLAKDAWYRDGAGAFTQIRVILRRPDEVTGFGAGRVMSDTVLADIRASEAFDPVAGDQILIGDETFLINAEPKRDRAQLVWRVELVPA
jgi:hypothetical protein